jgi:bifunctional UDP-N-acetylglucosamine pyrophosphorylase/glucosamine-1-phosphate N-acetyltransferase
MIEEKIAVVVLAAGLGTRMRSQRPKVLHKLAGRPMIGHLLETVDSLAPDRVVVVVGPDMDEVSAFVAPHRTAVQSERLGTGHAVAQAADLLDDFTGTVLVLYGDTPLLTRPTLEKLLARRRAAPHPAVVVLGFRPAAADGYGRLIVGADGLEAIVEVKDATPAQRAIPLCNSGVMAIDGGQVWELMARLDNKNAKGEYYLTDIVRLARERGATCAFVEGDENELLGVNSRAELATAETVLQSRLRQAAMDNGATLQDPDSVYFSFDTRLGQDVTIEPHVVFAPGVSVGDGVEIRAFSHLAGVTIGDGATIGPFARLRPGARVAEGAHVGNFVEIKNAVVETGAKVNHLTYIGDARIGAGANVGAGTITCNYDGFTKAHTDIGAGAFIGSNTSLVAPVKIGDGAVIGAGSVITKDVEADSLALARAPQTENAGGGARLRARKRAARKGS